MVTNCILYASLSHCMYGLYLKKLIKKQILANSDLLPNILFLFCLLSGSTIEGLKWMKELGYSP